MKNLLELLVRVLRSASVFSLVITFFTVLFQMIFRYLLNYSAYWTFEISVLFMIVTAFFGGSLAFLEREKGHVQIAYFLNMLPQHIRHWTQLGINFIMLAVSAIIFYGCCISLPVLWSTPHHSIPWLYKGWYFLVILIAMAFNILFIVIWTAQLIQTENLRIAKGG